MEPCADRFGEIMSRECAGCVMQYTGRWDVGPNEMWNDETSPDSGNCFSKQPSVRETGD